MCPSTEIEMNEKDGYTMNCHPPIKKNKLKLFEMDALEWIIQSESKSRQAVHYMLMHVCEI